MATVYYVCDRMLSHALPRTIDVTDVQSRHLDSGFSLRVRGVCEQCAEEALSRMNALPVEGVSREPSNVEIKEFVEEIG